MRRLALLLVAGVLLGAGCKVDAATTIRLAEDGSGSVAVRVSLDAEAVGVVERGGVPLEERIVVDDLREAGWRFSRWDRADDGRATLRMSHPFRDEEQLADLLAQLGGEDAFLRDVEVTRSRNFVQQRDGLTLVADLRGLRSGVRDDEELASRLAAAGVNVDAVDFILGQQLRSAFSLTVTLNVPGDKTRTFGVAPGERETVNLSSSTFQTNRFAVLLIGAMLVFLSLLLYLSASISARRRRARALEHAAARARRAGSRQPVM
jgi:hypothetical protein